MCRGYELLTGENCLAVIARSNQMGKSYQTELQTRFCWITERIIMNALKVWNRMMVWIKPSREIEVAEDSQILDLRQIQAGKASRGARGHQERQDCLAERLLDTYGNSILRLAYSYLHNYSDAEDILQETLIRYLQNAPQVTGPVHEKAWLLKVAANLSKNRIDYNRLRETDELNDELIGEEREDLSFIWEAVKSLPEKYREAIHLYYYEGYSTGQVAKLLGRKESSIRSDLKRGRERLKMMLKEAYDFE